MNDSELRALCHRFFDAIEHGDFDGMANCCTPEFALWFNATGSQASLEQCVAAQREGAKLQRRRTYDDRIVNTFDEGFLMQYSVTVVTHDGKRRSLSASTVAQCRDQRIARIEEYMDSGKFGNKKGAA